MKIASFALILATASSAHALQVGDFATYTVTAQNQAHELTTKVIGVYGNTLTLESFLDGASQGTEDAPSSDETEMANAYADCAASGGKIENTTVPAGSFKACHLVSNEQEIYFSPEVAFDVIKMKQMDDSGNATEIVLKAFAKH
jgi:hypothetical protein